MSAAPAASCPLCAGTRVCIPAGSELPRPCPVCRPECYPGRRIVVRGPDGLETVFTGPPPAAERGS